ncbi:MAG: helicase C-terminal domain-containing protein [Bacillota bacterium]|jgi:ATP-dependent DNA helicase DinG
MDYVVIDVETTGLEAGFNRIIEIGAVRIVNGVTCKEFSTLVNPNCPIPEEIVELTGITPEMLFDQPLIHEIIPELESFLVGAVLVAHNAGFDKSFLQPHLKTDYLWLDTLDLARILIPTESSYSLSHLAYALNIGDYQGHRAMPDVRVTVKLFLYLLKRLQQIDLKVLEVLYRFSPEQNDALSMLIAQEYLFRKKFFSQDKISSHTFFVSPQGQNTGLFAPKKTGPKNPRRYSSQEIEQLFVPGDRGGGLGPSYEYRPQQAEMARAVWDSFEKGRHLIVEAGTGTGKSLAYLLPALLWSIDSGNKVVISTHTINLQEQLLLKDIPLAKDILHKEFNTTVIKGRSHYLCLRKWENQAEQNSDRRWHFMRRLALWLSSSETGDCDELSFNPKEKNEWLHLAAHGDTCFGSRCKFFRGLCFVSRARKRVELSQIIIVNHSLLIANAIVDESILPGFNYLIIDEAHHLEKTAEEQLETQISFNRLLLFLNRLKKPMGNAGLLDILLIGLEKQRNIADGLKNKINKNIQDASEFVLDSIKYAEEFFSLIRSCFSTEHASGNGITWTIRILPKHRNSYAWKGISSSGENLMVKIQELIGNLSTIGENICFLENEHGIELSGAQEIGLFLSIFNEIKLNLKSFIFGVDDNIVSWVEFTRENTFPVLHTAPIDIKELLAQYLFTSKESVVLTSATLTVNGEFEFFKESIGIEAAGKSFRCLRLKSPFNYMEKVLFTIVSDIPNPANTPEIVFVDAVSNSLSKLVKASKGRTLVLFTSHSELKQVYKKVKGLLEQDGIMVFAHGITGNRAQLLENFKNHHQSVMMGTNSFWEGIDVVGQALSSVIIVKLPFWPPSLPMVAARLDKYRRQNIDGFWHYSLPQAIIRFKQGFGRLIRSSTDLGVVCVLDRRIFEKKYGRFFMESLPKLRVEVKPTDQLVTDVEEWLEKNQ